jgi:hypothetical protein
MTSRRGSVPESEARRKAGVRDGAGGSSLVNCGTRALAAKRRAEPEVTFHHAPRIEPGLYPAYCRSGDVYFDKVYRRHLAAIQFDVLSENGDEVLGRLTWFLNLGKKDKPNASRKSRYWGAWIKANGGPPQRRDRLSPRVFCGRMALVEVGDTTKDSKQNPVTGDEAYSVIRDVKEWLTGHRPSLAGKRMAARP